LFNHAGRTGMDRSDEEARTVGARHWSSPFHWHIRQPQALLGGRALCSPAITCRFRRLDMSNVMARATGMSLRVIG